MNNIYIDPKPFYCWKYTRTWFANRERWAIYCAYTVSLGQRKAYVHILVLSCSVRSRGPTRTDAARIPLFLRFCFPRPILVDPAPSVTDAFPELTGQLLFGQKLSQEKRYFVEKKAEFPQLGAAVRLCRLPLSSLRTSAGPYRRSTTSLGPRSRCHTKLAPAGLIRVGSLHMV